jgi:hypothetical protein
MDSRRGAAVVPPPERDAPLAVAAVLPFTLPEVVVMVPTPPQTPMHSLPEIDLILPVRAVVRGRRCQS